MRWQATAQVKRKDSSNGKRRNARNRSKSRKKRRPVEMRSRSRSKASNSSELEQQRRVRRCGELAEAELNEDHREERLLQARKQVEEVEEMNDSQRTPGTCCASIHAALSQTCTVVQGPPGTGKTSYLV
eukprot:g24617.t1